MSAVEQTLTYDVRVIAMQEAIDQLNSAINIVRVATHRLINADLFGARDVVSPVLYQMHKAHDALELQYRDLLNLEAGPLAQNHSGPRVGGRRSRLPFPGQVAATTNRPGRRKGIEIIPGSVKQARTEAGLSLAEIARGYVSRAAISLIENGHSRPSALTLRLIAERTGKPIEFFLGESK